MTWILDEVVTTSSILPSTAYFFERVPLGSGTFPPPRASDMRGTKAEVDCLATPYARQGSPMSMKSIIPPCTGCLFKLALVPCPRPIYFIAKLWPSSRRPQPRPSSNHHTQHRTSLNACCDASVPTGYGSTVIWAPLGKTEPRPVECDGVGATGVQGAQVVVGGVQGDGGGVGAVGFRAVSIVAREVELQ
ncbi:hypothetical protein M427DRAFT_235438 [Gonapodya prolifera JEL478]|uniref:Uncharacterized protein n=1 Tax=Gonapodya prolifera (strain JEL478) TaxID=1344416 RepID=A0A139AMC8_GONPJ|nr:hypothetical protein M427DRAFT_235438 [Gonapodya prolifera JEL478]|eukprot:KXS17921.1 hypothetical protein M427DRAFT_235438 [Gonapodya prolifera JEL478]